MAINVQGKRVPGQVRIALVDLDGTAARCTDIISFEATRQVLEARGLTLTGELHALARGRSREDGLRRIFLASKRQDLLPFLAEIAMEKNNTAQRMREKLSPGDVPASDRSVLKQLRQSGLWLVIGSSSRNGLDTLNRVRLTAEFDAIITGNEAPEKDEIWKLALSYFKARPDEALVIEDAQAGIDEAVKLGVAFSIGIGDPGLEATVYAPTLGALEVK